MSEWREFGFFFFFFVPLVPSYSRGFSAAPSTGHGCKVPDEIKSFKIKTKLFPARVWSQNVCCCRRTANTSQPPNSVQLFDWLQLFVGPTVADRLCRHVVVTTWHSSLLCCIYLCCMIQFLLSLPAKDHGSFNHVNIAEFKNCLVDTLAHR